MGQNGELNVGIVGLGFGAEFIPIYLEHPNTNMYALCEQDNGRLSEVGDRFDIGVRYQDYGAMLKDKNIDVVHVNTPPMFHAEHALGALRAGKHVASTIPMALSVDDCKELVEAQHETGLVYMMFETAIYSREFLFVKQLYEDGALGKIQFVRGAHHQDMTGWPSYWEGLPPLYNGTHAMSPTFALGDNQAEFVECLGSGRVFDRMQGLYGSPFAIETTHVKFKDSDLVAEVTRHLWATACQYRESFDVYGSVRAFEWARVDGEEHVLHLGETPQRVPVPDFADRLPEPIRRFTTRGMYSGRGSSAERAFVQGGGHGGSHPHLVHRFVRAVLGDVDPYPNVVQAANITCSGILSHESALHGGDRMYLPEWTFLPDHAPLIVPLDQDREPPWAGMGWASGLTSRWRKAPAGGAEPVC